ncbi:DUF5105 domain-containing protein [Bacillus changyiensis]|uniref:DUF5105 domain-containing protein n=1 Tax=Bacillus changyiensis TaxID=3004103 RepID=UPI0022E88C82|nr:DUF5105 domain-containing protein [Bacillus changyiensis]MDA1477944.1 DUF5105 domain-containing protein [Bacillus changyiensis]
MNHKKFFLIILLCMTAMFSTACSENKQSSENSKNSAATNQVKEKAEPKKPSYKAKFKILHSEYIFPYSPDTKLSKDELILKLSLFVENNGEEQLRLDKSAFNLYEGDVKTTNNIDITAADSNEVSKELGYTSLNPGKSIEGTIYFLVDKGQKYKFAFTPDGDQEYAPIETEIDGKKLLDSAKKLDDPAKALLAYTDITIFGKDNDNFEKLTGEHKREVISEYRESFAKTLFNDLDITTEVDDDKKLNHLIDTVQHVYQEKTKVKAVTKAIRRGEAIVEANITPIDYEKVKKQVKNRHEDYKKSKGDDFYDDDLLVNPAIKFMTEEIKKAQQASTEKTVQVTMYNDDNNKWQLDFEDDGLLDLEYFSSFHK